MRRRPDFIIIGAMKCMTSTLHEQLAAQPGIFMTTPKEPCFFSDDHVFERGLEWYESLFESALPEDICGESSTHYTKLPTYPRTVERIARICPNAKFVYVMRHPIDRLVSHYIHSWTQREVSCSINDAIYQLPEMVEYGRYDYQIEPYIDTFGFERVLPVFYDRLRCSPEQELQRIARFLGRQQPVFWDKCVDQQNASSARLRRDALRDVIVNAPGLSWMRKTLVPRSVRDWGKGFWQMRERPQLDSNRMEELVERFDESLARLGERLNFELNCSNFREVTRDHIPKWSLRTGSNCASTGASE